LNAEQGGRSSGPPATPENHDCAATAYLPPWTAVTGLASFVIRVTSRQSWTSAAEAGWLAPRDDERFLVRPGAVLVVTEGVKIVGYFHVEEVTDQR
jgi:hypothetical protein